MRTLTILGATGSIGASTLDLVRRNRAAFRVVALTGNGNVAVLAGSGIASAGGAQAFGRQSSPLPFRGGAGGGASALGVARADRPHPNPSPEGEGLFRDRSHALLAFEGQGRFAARPRYPGPAMAKAG